MGMGIQVYFSDDSFGDAYAQCLIDELDALLANVSSLDGKQVCLQPISQQKRATELAVRTCIERNWRLSLQTHKYIGIE